MGTKKNKFKEKKDTEKKKESKKLEKELIEENKKLKDELQEKNDKLLRSYADLQNLQKRIKKDIITNEIKIKQKYFSELIDLYEILKKAYNDDNPKEGIKIILNNIENFFEKENIECIDCIGKKFDHTLHHAITTIENSECSDGEIVDEIKKGFKINETVLRPSHVVVVKNNKKDKK